MQFAVICRKPIFPMGSGGCAITCAIYCSDYGRASVKTIRGHTLDSCGAYKCDLLTACVTENARSQVKQQRLSLRRSVSEVPFWYIPVRAGVTILPTIAITLGHRGLGPRQKSCFSTALMCRVHGTREQNSRRSMREYIHPVALCTILRQDANTR